MNVLDIICAVGMVVFLGACWVLAPSAPKAQDPVQPQE